MSVSSHCLPCIETAYARTVRVNACVRVCVCVSQAALEADKEATAKALRELAGVTDSRDIEAREAQAALAAGKAALAELSASSDSARAAIDASGSPLAGTAGGLDANHVLTPVAATHTHNAYHSN